MDATLSGVQYFNRNNRASNNSKRAPINDRDLNFVCDILAPDLLLLIIGISVVFGLMLLVFK